MIRFFVLSCCFSFYLLARLSNALLLLEETGESLQFSRQAPADAQGVVTRSAVEELLDWHVVPADDGMRFHLAFLLKPEGTTRSKFTEASLVAVCDVVTRCLHAPVLTSRMNRLASVTLCRSRTAVQFLYTCSDGNASETLHILLAQWRDGNLSVAVDEPVLSFGVSKSWLLPRDMGEAAVQLIYVLTSDRTITGVLLEGLPGSASDYSPSIMKLRLPHGTVAGETELVSSCFLPSVGLSGLVRHSQLEGISYFELHRIFPQQHSAELLLETSTTVFTDLSANERDHCSFSSRVVFSDCNLSLSVVETLHVRITLTAALESPVTDSTPGFGGWVECGRTLLEGSAVFKDSGLRVLVSPLRRVHFHRTLSIAQISSETEREVGSTRGRMDRCTFHSSGLKCEGPRKNDYMTVRGVSRHCAGTRAWWRSHAGPDHYLCEWFGMSLTDILSLFFAFFTSACGVQLAAELLLLWGYSFFSVG